MCAAPSSDFEPSKWLAPPTDCEYTLEDFPDPDLFPQLVNLYFGHTNAYLPLLNRIIFQKGIDEGLHLNDEAFGSVVLLVCAIGARFSDDPRVIFDAENSFQTAGWKWFTRVQSVRKSFDLKEPRLYDVQVPTVSVLGLRTH